MSGLLKKVASLITGNESRDDAKTRATTALITTEITDRDLLRQESKIGATLFGPVPKGRNREFFCLDESTWIWHEEWRDEKNIERQTTVRYEIHPKGVLKVSDGPRYQFIEGDELANFAQATRLYYEETSKKIYMRDPHTGLKFA